MKPLKYIIIIASLFGLVHAADKPTQFQDSHYDVVIKQWATNTSISSREQTEEVYWAMLTHDVELITEQMPFKISDTTTAIAITLDNRVLTYTYSAIAEPAIPGTPEGYLFEKQLVERVCTGKYTTFHLVAMDGTYVFAYHVNGSQEPINNIVITATACGPGA